MFIPASLKVGVTMARSKTQIPGIFFFNFYKSEVLTFYSNMKPYITQNQRSSNIQLFHFCLLSNTKILTTLVFDHPLLTTDGIILVKNLDTVGKFFYIQAKEVFYEIVFFFLVVTISMK